MVDGRPNQGMTSHARTLATSGFAPSRVRARYHQETSGPLLGCPSASMSRSPGGAAALLLLTPGGAVAQAGRCVRAGRARPLTAGCWRVQESSLAGGGPAAVFPRWVSRWYSLTGRPPVVRMKTCPSGITHHPFVVRVGPSAVARFVSVTGGRDFSQGCPCHRQGRDSVCVPTGCSLGSLICRMISPHYGVVSFLGPLPCTIATSLGSQTASRSCSIFLVADGFSRGSQEAPLLLDGPRYVPRSKGVLRGMWRVTRLSLLRVRAWAKAWSSARCAGRPAGNALTSRT